jgi:hypothetical protein
MVAFLVVPASALFLHAYGAQRLAWVYLGVAAVGVAVTWVMTRAQRRWSLARLALTVLATYAVLVAAGWALVDLASNSLATAGLLVLFPLSIPVGFMLVGAQAGRLLDVRQIKAHFGKVAAGFSIGFALGGLAAAGLVGPLGGPERLLLVDVGLALLFLALVGETSTRYAASLRVAPPSPAGAAPVREQGGPLASARRATRAVLRSRLVLLVFGYQFCTAAVMQLLDYLVWERAAHRYPDPDDLARFQGVFGAVINVTSVVFVFGVAGWLLTRFGIRAGLAANPLGVLVVLGVSLGTGWVAGVASLGFFLALCAQQVVDLTLTDGTTRTSVNASYQALPAAGRLSAQTRVEAAGVPLALGFVGGVLLLWPRLGLGLMALLVLTFVVSAGWLVLAVLVYRQYTRDLQQALGTRAWDPVSLRVDDAQSQAAVDRLLDSLDPIDVRLGLDVLATARPAALGPRIAQLLTSQVPVLQLQALEVLAGARDGTDGRAAWAAPTGATAEVAESSDAVGDRIRDSVLALLATDTADERVRAEAATVAYDWPQAGPALHHLVFSGSAVVRAAALVALVHRDGAAADVEAFGDGISGPGGDELLAAATASPHPALARTLLAAARDRHTPTLDDAVRAHARWLGSAVDEVLRDGVAPTTEDVALLRSLAASGDPSCVTALLPHLLHPDPATADAVLRGLARSGARLPAAGRSVVDSALDRRCDRASRARTALDSIAALPGTELLAEALRDVVARARAEAFDLLGLVHPRRLLERVEAQLGDADPGRRALALETLEVTVGHQWAQQVARLFAPLEAPAENAPGAEPSHRDGPGAEPSRRDGPGAEAARDWVRRLVLDSDEAWDEGWVRVCALHASARLLPDAAELAAGLGDDSDPVVAETAGWVLTHSGPA